MVKKFNISCDEATTICDKSQYGEATFLDKVKLTWHLFMCRICAKYSKQNSIMTQVYQLKSSDCKEIHKCMSSEEKVLLRTEMKEFQEHNELQEYR